MASRRFFDVGTLPYVVKLVFMKAPSGMGYVVQVQALLDENPHKLTVLYFRNPRDAARDSDYLEAGEGWEPFISLMESITLERFPITKDGVEKVFLRADYEHKLQKERETRVS